MEGKWRDGRGREREREREGGEGGLRGRRALIRARGRSFGEIAVRCPALLLHASVNGTRSERVTRVTPMNKPFVF